MKIILVTICILFSTHLSYSQSTPELKQQAYEEYQKSDKAMNAAYQKLITILSEDGKKKLRLTQRAWIAFRNTEADFDSHHFGEGKLGAIERLGSMNLQTQARTKKLLADFKRFKEING